MNNTEKEMQCVTHWFSGWSPLQKEDFQKDLLDKNDACSKIIAIPLLHRLIPNNVDLLFDSMKSLGVSDKPPSIFHCQLKLFSEWFSVWTDAERNDFLLKLRVLDPSFVARFNEEAARLQQEQFS